MKTGYTDVTVLLDRSGSMATLKESVEQGFREFIGDQAAQPGECTVTLVQFDYSDAEARASIVTDYAMRSVRELPTLTLVPRGWTPLYDAIGTVITQVGERYSGLSEDQRPEKVVFVIVTDDLDNRSREYTRKRVADMIAHQRERYNWQFVFLGANMDALEVAASFNIPVAGAATYTSTGTGVRNAFGGMSTALSTYRQNDGETLAFTEADRNAMQTAP